MNDQTTPWGLLLSFGGLIFIATITLLYYWRYASNWLRVLLSSPFVCLLIMLTTWDSFLEELGASRPYQKDPLVLVGWPEYKETLIVIKSKRTENSLDTVTTKCFDSRGKEILVFHRDEGLKKGDIIQTTSNGVVQIIRESIPEIAGK